MPWTLRFRPDALGSNVGMVDAVYIDDEGRLSDPVSVRVEDITDPALVPRITTEYAERKKAMEGEAARVAEIQTTIAERLNS